MKKTRMPGTLWLALTLATWILLVGLRGGSLAGDAGPGPLNSALRGFNEAASSFDPFGHALNPLEEAVPNLYLRGMLRNRTMIDLHGHSDSLPNGKSKHYDLQFAEWLAELEVQYPLTRNISLVNIYNFLYDAAFDWEGAGRLGADAQGRHLLSEKVASEREYTRHTKHILRELYTEISHGDWFFRLGKQQVVWGKMDGKVIDIINPTWDWLGPTATQDNYKWTRIPTWLATAMYAWGDFDFQLIWNPDFEPGQGPPPGDVFSRSSGYDAQRRVVDFHALPRRRPAGNFKNGEFGLRTNWIKNGWDMGAIYWHAWDDFPTRFRRGLDLQGNLREELKHTRLHHFGYNLDKSFGWLGRNWVWRMESLYTLDDYLPTRGESGPWRDGVTKTNQLISATAIETSALRGNLSLLFQASNHHLFKYDRGDMGPFKTKRDRTLWLLSTSYTFNGTGDRLTVGATHHNVLEEGEWKGTYRMGYKLSDFVRLSAEVSWFSGHSDDPTYGAWDDLDQLRLSLTYSF